MLRKHTPEQQSGDVDEAAVQVGADERGLQKQEVRSSGCCVSKVKLMSAAHGHPSGADDRPAERGRS